jgi:hypothetical protein
LELSATAVTKGSELRHHVRMRALAVALVAPTALLSALPALGAFDVRHCTLALAASAVSGAGVAAATRGPKIPSLISWALTALGLTVFLSVVAGSPIQAWEHLSQVPRALLSETLPIEGPLGVVAPVFAAAWMCAAASVDLLLRGRPHPRTLLWLSPPVLTYALAYAAAIRASRADLWTAPALLVLLAFCALGGRILSGRNTRGGLERTGGKAPRMATGWAFAPAASALGAIAIAAALLPSPPRLDPGRSVPVTTELVADPLDTMAGLRDPHNPTASRVLLDARLSAPSTGYLAALVLDRYDGGSWTADTTYEPTGGRIPAPAVAHGRRGPALPVSQVMVLRTQLPAGSLPALDRPSWVHGAASLTDPVTGEVAAATGAGPPAAYDVTSGPGFTLPELSSADLIDHPPGGGDDLSVPSDASKALDVVTRFLAGVTGRQPAPTVGFLQAVVGSLRSQDRQVVPPPTSPADGSTVAAADLGGTALAQVVNAVSVDRAATPEQFATFVAVVARHLGVPARIVSGFRLATTSAGRAVRAGRYRVTGREAWTWLEVPVVGLGWVVVDPTPDSATLVTAPPPAPAKAVAMPPATRRTSAVGASGVTASHPLAPPVHLKVRHRGRVHSLPAAPAVAAVGIALVLAGIPGQAAVRRRRRRGARFSGDPARLAVGAWLELLDGLLRAGMAPHEAATSSEVAAVAADHFGSEIEAPVILVGQVADRALFAPSRPTSADDAATAWRTQAEVVRRVLRSLDRRQRLRAMLTVGPVSGNGRRRRRRG